MNREVVKYKDSEDAYAIVKKQIEQYDEQNDALIQKLRAIHHNYRGEKKLVDNLVTLADKEKELAIDEDTRLQRLRSNLVKKEKEKQGLEKQVYKLQLQYNTLKRE